jgi:hypothetical protein
MSSLMACHPYVRKGATKLFFCPSTLNTQPSNQSLVTSATKGF